MSFRSSRGVLTAALSLVALAASPAVAWGEVERPVQGESSNGLFLSYAPKPDDEGAVCFVDSGIDENPDTEDAIIERTSVAGDGSSGEDGFRFDAYRNAIQRCRQLKTEEGLPIKVVLLALGGSDSPSDSDLERLEDSVTRRATTGSTSWRPPATTAPTR